MADSEKYYYLRLKEDFFEDDAVQILESMQDGYLYSNILLKLYLKSLKYDGKLMFNERIPYNATVLSTITRHQVGTVEKALSVFNELGLIEVLDNGAMYMLDIQNFIGKTSTEADRKRAYRERIEEEKQLLLGQMSGQIADECLPEIDIKKDIKKDVKKDIKRKSHEYEKKYSDDSFEMKCVQYLINSIRSEMPDAAIPDTDIKIDKWCDSIEKMVRLDIRSMDDIYNTLIFAREDSFWKPNIRSTSKFREKYETLYLQMKNKKTPQPKQPEPKQSKYNQYPQREYGVDKMAELERKLLNKGL